VEKSNGFLNRVSQVRFLPGAPSLWLVPWVAPVKPFQRAFVAACERRFGVHQMRIAARVAIQGRSRRSSMSMFSAISMADYESVPEVEVDSAKHVQACTFASLRHPWVPLIPARPGNVQAGPPDSSRTAATFPPRRRTTMVRNSFQLTPSFVARNQVTS
jgi:hypothetical protein